MSAEFPDLCPCYKQVCPNALCKDDVEKNVKDWNIKAYQQGRSPYVVNGVPISRVIEGCCVNDHCLCRTEVIWYNGVPYDQKPYLAARLRSRNGNVMYLEGKITPPFSPGKSPHIFGPYRKRDQFPQSMAFSSSQFGRSLDPCCTTSIYNDVVPPYHNTTNYGYSRKGLPYGETLGYFRLKPNEPCDWGSIQRLQQCCTCEPGESNPAFYAQDECPPRKCCC